MTAGMWLTLIPFVCLILAAVVVYLCTPPKWCLGEKFDEYEREIMECDKCRQKKECMG